MVVPVTFTHGQSKPVLIFTGKVTDVSGKKLDGVEVILKKIINLLKLERLLQMESMIS